MKKRSTNSKFKKRGFEKKDTQPSKVKSPQSTKAKTPEYDFSQLPTELQPNSSKEGTRLNKYIANAGICSRREADKLIAEGEITINGKVVTELGTKVFEKDVVCHGKQKLSAERLVYVLLNKPKDHITTMDDPFERKTVMNLVKNACEERIFPVGRLDRNTTGLLLLTNDGDVSERLSHPSNNIRKIYEVVLDKPLEEEHFDSITEGFDLEDGFIKIDSIAVSPYDQHVVGVEIHSGKNRIVRRIFEHFKYEVVKLDRTVYAGFSKKNLTRGKWRFLTEKEVLRLKQVGNTPKSKIRKNS